MQSRSIILYPDAHGVARGKIVCGNTDARIEIGCASGVFSKDIYGNPQLFDTLATPSGAADIRVLASDAAVWKVNPRADALFGASSLFIGAVTNVDSQPHPLDFRSILADYIEANPNLDRFRIGGELEFFLRPVNPDAALRSDGQAYALSGASLRHECLEAMLSILDDVGIAWTGLSQENTEDQYEISLRHGTLLEQADSLFLARFLLRHVAAVHGLRCTFVPVIDKGGAPGNLHLHVSDTKTAEINHLVTSAFSALEGSLLAFCPTCNSRLVSQLESFSSKSINAGHGHRFKAVRIVNDGESTRIELRTPTSDANPYLAFLVLAGHFNTCSQPLPLDALMEKDTPIDWDFGASISAFRKDAVVNSVLSTRSVELFSELKRLEAMASDKYSFAEETLAMMTVL
ncbi:MAG: hypothetical protein CSB44_07560 [Gammaproteobacteria bacterium]|nr:MAG: hypothetical protein CSB44_07560 [Gammaproteobacteria bacterium]